MASRFFIGCAGWSLPKAQQAAFDTPGTHLARYAGRFPAVEINSSFYRPHRPTTYARWAESVPETFRFSVKLPKTITHGQRLVDAEALLDEFLTPTDALGPRLGCLLVQLPPSLAFDDVRVDAFLKALRERRPDTGVALEPRHASWFTDEADGLLVGHRVARVAADPALSPRAAEPGGWPGLTYVRLHGSPRVYYSAYGPKQLEPWAAKLAAAARHATQVWCILDNTAAGEATSDALTLMRLLR